MLMKFNRREVNRAERLAYVSLSDPVEESRRLSNGWEKIAFMITRAVLQLLQSCLQVMVHYAYSIRLMTARHGRPKCPDHALSNK